VSGHGTYANFEAIEGTVSGEETFTLKRKSRKVVITNDSASTDLRYKFNSSEDFGTLGGTESLSLYFTTNQVILDGSNVPYRIWVYG
jgi:hypothetical protein